VTAVDFIALILFTNQVVETLHHAHGEVFCSLRARAEESGGFFGSLLSCPFCFSQWVGPAAALWFAVVQLVFWLGWIGTAGDLVAYFPVYGLAASRGAQILSDLTHQWCRSPLRGLPPGEQS